MIGADGRIVKVSELEPDETRNTQIHVRPITQSVDRKNHNSSKKYHREELIGYNDNALATTFGNPLKGYQNKLT